MIQKYTKNGETLWRVRFTKRSTRFGRVEKRESGIKTAQEANRVLKRLSEEALREIYDRENAGCSWQSLIGEWELGLRQNRGIDRPVGKATSQDYVRALEIYTDQWMKRPVSEITRQDVREILELMSTEGRSNSRKRAILNAINHIFRWGADNGFLKAGTVSPATGIKVSREEHKKPDILTLNEIRTLVRASQDLKHVWSPIWKGALLTGMRSGELFALEWSDIDWENKRLTVARSWNGRLKVIKSTKGGYWREVPINDDLDRLLKEQRASAGSRRFVFPRLIDWQRGEAARVLRAFCQGIGIPSVKFHALRACFATQLLRDKQAPAVVMKICGWKDLKTMQRYIRLAGIEVEGATDGLKILPEEAVMGRVVQLFGSGQEPPTGG